MKKMLIMLLTLGLIISASSCQSPQSSPASSISPSATSITGSTQTAQNSPDPSQPSAELPKYNVNNIVGVDQFGRTFDIIGGEKSEKQVGMFYFLWLGQPLFSGVYDATKIYNEYGEDVLFHETSDISPEGQFHFWGEPLYGYYNSGDEYVIRKHIELLITAGIDFLIFDSTNAVTYDSVYQKIMKIIDEYMQAGWDAPKVAFYTHSYSIQTANKLYENVYKANYYPNTWYLVDGKPLIIAYTDPADDMAEAQSRGDSSYKPQEFSQEFLDFFTIKRPQWPSDPTYADGFPWMEWTYPQPEHNGIMNVSVAAHPGVPFSFSITRPGHLNWGRGYNPLTGKNNADKVNEGLFFQYSWDTVHSADPDTVFVTGWNEWIALKTLYDGEYMLCDAANLEYSRDIEMMKGEYNDAFYIQLIKNVRQFKGLDASSETFKTHTIDLNGDISQWDEIDAVYRNIGDISYGRDYRGCTVKVKYKTDAPENNLQTVKAAHDDENLYFLIQADAGITSPGEASNWCNIFIGTGEPSLKGWEGYEYVINRSVDGSSSSIERLDEGFNCTNVGQAEIKLDVNNLIVKVPRAAVGLTDSAQFYFKVADGVEHQDDIMDYYVTGRSMPMGHLSYKYNG